MQVGGVILPFVQHAREPVGLIRVFGTGRIDHDFQRHGSKAGEHGGERRRIGMCQLIKRCGLRQILIGRAPPVFRSGIRAQRSIPDLVFALDPDLPPQGQIRQHRRQ